MSAAAATTGTTPLRERVVGAAAIVLAASLVIQNAVVPGRGARLRGPDRGGARLPRGEPGRGRDRGRPGGAARAAAARVRDRSPRARRASRGCGRGPVAPRGGRGRDSPAVFALYAVLWVGVVLSAGELAEPSPVFELAWQMHAAAFALAAAGARHHVHRRCTGDACERADAAVAASARRGRGSPADRRRDGEPRDRGRLGAPVRRAATAWPPGSCGWLRPAYGWCALEPPPRKKPEKRGWGGVRQGVVEVVTLSGVPGWSACTPAGVRSPSQAPSRSRTPCRRPP